MYNQFSLVEYFDEILINYLLVVNKNPTVWNPPFRF